MITPEMHDTVRRWLTGLGPPQTPAGRDAWLYVRLVQRARRHEYTGTSAEIKAVSRLHEQQLKACKPDLHWWCCMATMMSSYDMRADSIAQHLKRYKIHRRKGGRI